MLKRGGFLFGFSSLLRGFAFILKTCPFFRDAAGSVNLFDGSGYERTGNVKGFFSGSRVVMAHTSFRQDRKWNLHDLMTKLTSSVFATRCRDSGTKWMLTFP